MGKVTYTELQKLSNTGNVHEFLREFWSSLEILVAIIKEEKHYHCFYCFYSDLLLATSCRMTVQICRVGMESPKSTPVLQCKILLIWIFGQSLSDIPSFRYNLTYQGQLQWFVDLEIRDGCEWCLEKIKSGIIVFELDYFLLFTSKFIFHDTILFITLPTKVCLVKAMVFPLVMDVRVDCGEGWAPKNWCFWTVVLEKTQESLGLQGDPAGPF